MELFTNIRALIIDMDGVLWHGTQPIPGLTDFFQTLHEQQIRFILATNNASLTPEQYVTKLARMGVAVDQNQILTSGIATALYLSEQVNPTETRVFVVGEDGATQPLIERGFTLTGLYEVNNDNDPVKKAQILWSVARMKP
jgi:4-nitrophenyl phosphatase